MRREATSIACVHERADAVVCGMVCGMAIVWRIGQSHKHQTESNPIAGQSRASTGGFQGHPEGPISYHWPLGNLSCLSRAAMQPCGLQLAAHASCLLLIRDATSRFGALLAPGTSQTIREAGAWAPRVPGRPPRPARPPRKGHVLAPAPFRPLNCLLHCILPCLPKHVSVV